MLPYHPGTFAPAWLSPDRKRLALVSFYGRWGFVRELEPATGRVVRERVLRAPGELCHPQVDWDEQGLRLFDDGPHRLLLVADDAHDVLRWDDLEGVLPDDEERLDPFLLPGTSRIWAQVERDCVSHDLDRRRADRTLTECMPVVAVLGPGEARVATDRVGEGALLLDAKGHVLAKGDRIETLAGAAAHPSGEGVLALETVEAFGGQPSAARLHALGRSPHEPFSLGEDTAHSPPDVATSLALGCTFVAHEPTHRRHLLTAVRWNGAALEMAWQREVPAKLQLVQDLHAGEVVALSPCARGLRVEPLAATAPEPFELLAERFTPETRPPFGDHCCWLSRASGLRPSAFQERFELTFGESRLKIAHELLEASGGDGETAAELILAMERAGGEDVNRAFIGHCLTRFPGHPALAIWRAWQLGVGEDWRGLRDLLVSQAASSDDQMACLHWHLRGLAHFHLGELEAALGCWGEGAGLAQPGCSMLELLAAVSPLVHPEGTAPLPPPAAALDTATIRVTHAVARAATCRRRGDWRAARSCLDVPDVHRLADRQVDALLAEAWLGEEPQDPFERLRMARALARLVEKRSFASLPLATAALGPEEEQRVVHRAETWLNRFAVTP
ncbi:MAG: hypothetical protein QM765_05675 [Myxococcales bacterium]